MQLAATPLSTSKYTFSNAFNGGVATAIRRQKSAVSPLNLWLKLLLAWPWPLPNNPLYFQSAFWPFADCNTISSLATEKAKYFLVENDSH